MSGITDNNIPMITVPQMKSMIDRLAVNKRRVLYFHGPSGIGKSEGIQQSCAANSGVMLDIRVSQYESVDFRGIPDIQDGATVWNMPATLPFKGNKRFDEDGPLIYLFLDEINQGDPSVLSVLYQLLNDRRVGEHILMDNVVIICAGNRDKDRGLGGRFPDPLNNRMSHFELMPDIKSWTTWASQEKKSNTLIGFLNFRSELLHTHDPNKPIPAFCTPRSWTHAEQDFIDPAMTEEDRMLAVASSVGTGPAIELMGFAKIMSSLHPIEDIIANPEGVPIDTDKLDVQWAMATHVSGHMSKDNADQLQKFLARLAPEMCVMAWTLAINRDDEVTNTNAFVLDYAPRFRGLFQN